MSGPAPTFLPPPPPRPMAALRKSTSAVAYAAQEFPGASPLRQRAVSEAKRAKLVEQLSVRDALLEPDVVGTLEAFLRVSSEIGSAVSPMEDAAEEAAKLLSNNYSSSGDFATILASWLEAVQPGAARELVSAHIREAVLRASETEDLDASLLYAWETNAPPSWLMELLRSDSDRAWLLELVQSKPWSAVAQVVVDALAATALKTERDWTALASSGFAPSLNFALYERAVTEALLALLYGRKTDEGEGSRGGAVVYDGEAERAFWSLALGSSHAWAFSARLLRDLESSAPQKYRPIFARLSARLSSSRPGVSGLARLESEEWTPLDPSTNAEVFKVASCVRAVILGQRDACEAAMEMDPLWGSGPAVSDDALRWLRDERFLQRLVSGVFAALRSDLSPEARSACARVLARGIGSGDEESDASSAKLVATIERLSALCNEETDCADATGVARTCAALLEHAGQHPALRLGSLCWARALLFHPRFATLYFVNFVSHARALGELAEKLGTAYPLHRPHATAFLVELLHYNADSIASATGSNRSEESESATVLDSVVWVQLAEFAVDALVQLYKLGMVLPLLDHLRLDPRVEALDRSVLRRIVGKLMETSNPPYSSVFQSAMGEILKKPSVVASMTGGGDLELKKRYDRFLAAMANPQLRNNTP